MNKRVKRILLCVLFLFVLTFTIVLQTTVSVQAGFGDYNDYGGGYDYGSSSDDYEGGRNSGKKTSRFEFTDILIIILVVYMAIFIPRNHTIKNSTDTKPVKIRPAKPLPNRTNEISKFIKQTDPAFSLQDFRSFAKQVYMDIQEAWQKRDLEPVRTLLHQNLYQQIQLQIEKKIDAGIVSHLEQIRIKAAYLTSFSRDSEYEYLSIGLSTSMIDYQVREATGEILYGNKETPEEMFYVMTFMRTKGVTTRSIKEKAQTMMCKNCGAPLQRTSSGKCEYCDSDILIMVYDWVLLYYGVVREDNEEEEVFGQ